MAAVVKNTGNNAPTFVSPAGYEVIDTGFATEAFAKGDLGVLGASGWSKAPAGALDFDGVALLAYMANQDGCDFLQQGEVDGFTGLTPGARLWPSATVSGGIDTSAPAGYGGANSRQQLTITGGPTGGSITYTIFGEDAVFAWNSSAAAAQTMLEALNAFVPGDVTVTGGALPGTPIVAEFTGLYANRPVPIFVLKTNGLTGGTSPAGRVDILQSGERAIPSASRMKAATTTRIRFLCV